MRPTRLPRDDHGEESKREADDLEQSDQRRDDEHTVEEVGLGRKHEYGRRGEEQAGRGDAGTKHRRAFCRQTESEDNESGDNQNGFGRGETQEFEVVHGLKNRSASTAG
jgi:hypothetical protein